MRCVWCFLGQRAPERQHRQRLKAEEQPHQHLVCLQESTEAIATTLELAPQAVPQALIVPNKVPEVKHSIQGTSHRINILVHACKV